MITVGPNFAGSGANSTRSGSAGAWTSPSVATGAPDSSVPGHPLVGSVGVGAYTDYLTLTNFGFSIPLKAYIRGVLFEVNVQNLDSDIIRDSEVFMVVSGTRSGNNLASGTNWPSSFTYISHGGSGNLWGNNLTPAIVNATNFGFAISITSPNGGFHSPSANLDNVRATVYYDLTDTGGVI